MNPQQPSIVEMAMPIVLIFVVFYFFIIRPQGKKMKEQQDFQSQLKRGDEVVTSAGILGVIDGLTEQFVTLEVSNNVKIKILRKQILGLQAQILAAANNSNNNSKVKA